MTIDELKQFVGKEIEIIYNDDISCKGHLSVYYGQTIEFRVYDFDLHYSFLIKPKNIKRIEVLKDE